MSLLRRAELTQEWAMQEGMLSAQLSLTMSAWLCDSLPFNLTPLTRGPHSGVVNLEVSHTLNSSPTALTAGHSGRGLLGGDAGGGGMLLPPSLHLSACHMGTRLATSLSFILKRVWPAMSPSVSNYAMPKPLTNPASTYSELFPHSFHCRAQRPWPPRW